MKLKQVKIKRKLIGLFHMDIPFKTLINQISISFADNMILNIRISQSYTNPLKTQFISSEKV
ncbi:hypothetical protein JWG40_15550 [Leptospira sp. 201903074]|uniref:hypothetical protein n=1 Tax=Leptospira abararensis TaxID=2810036 RepID=UPI001965D799|nr:hypothetical protein [Leptospira abararensis]MBM9548442.1 hypothetical protein [Leptospira abararensis]